MDGEILHGLLSRPDTDTHFYGVVAGVVTNNQDPDKMHRVKVRFPWLSTDDESNWARVVCPMAGNRMGTYFLPEVGDEVLVAFEHGAIDHPYVIGSLWNGRDAPPESNDDGNNNCRTIRSRSGHVVRLNDEHGSECIEIIDYTGDNKITIHSTDGSLSIEAKGDLTIRSTAGKVSIAGTTGVEIKSQASAEFTAMASLDLKATGPVSVKGAVINLN